MERILAKIDFIEKTAWSYTSSNKKNVKTKHAKLQNSKAVIIYFSEEFGPLFLPNPTTANHEIKTIFNNHFVLVTTAYIGCQKWRNL